jgi:hypothetical protein
MFCTLSIALDLPPQHNPFVRKMPRCYAILALAALAVTGASATGFYATTPKTGVVAVGASTPYLTCGPVRFSPLPTQRHEIIFSFFSRSSNLVRVTMTTRSRASPSESVLGRSLQRGCQS